MSKEFIPYEEALALTELGFDESCFGVFFEDKQLKQIRVKTQSLTRNLDKGTFFCLAPLYQQAFRWFREKHNLESIIEPRWKFTGAEKKYCTEVFDESDESDVRSNDDIYHTDFNTYEEAELACLRKLIELLKLKEDE